MLEYKCNKCGATLKIKDRICSSCNTKVVDGKSDFINLCSRCKKFYQAGKVICPHCGHIDVFSLLIYFAILGGAIFFCIRIAPFLNISLVLRVIVISVIGVILTGVYSIFFLTLVRDLRNRKNVLDSVKKK